MNNTAVNCRRKQIFSNPGVQIKIVITFVFLALLYSLVNYYVVKSTLWSFSADVLQLPLTESNREDVNLLLDQQGVTVNIQLALFSVLMLAVVALGGSLMSHRLAGPIYRLRKYLQEIEDGSLDPRILQFRKQDFFNELADSFNLFQESRGILTPRDQKDA